MLEGKKLPGAPETRLHLVKRDQDVVRPTPGGHRLDVRRRREARAAPLEGFHDDPGHAVRPDPLCLQRPQEPVEACVPAAESVRKRHLVHVGVQVDDPLLEGGDAPHHLGAECAPVKIPLEADDADLPRPAATLSVCAHELHGALNRLGARGEQERLAEALGRRGAQGARQLDSLGVREAERVQEPALDSRQDGVPDLLGPVAGVGHQHSGAPVEPHVAEPVVNLDPVRTVPQDGWLAQHICRLVPPHGIENLQGIRGGYRGHDPPKARLHGGYRLRGEVKGLAHERVPPGWAGE